MKIPLNDDYRLASDKYQWIVQRKRAVVRQGKRVEEWENLSYHPTATKAVNHHAETLFRESDAETIDEAIEAAKRITTALSEALQTPKFEVIVK